MPAADRQQRLQLTGCPQCGATAEIEYRAVLESTDGPIEHARVTCVARHWFLLPVAYLADDTPVTPRATGRSTTVQG